ncbi:MAG: hypothetical protein ABFE01_00205 [Phycisphaerales bacterium]
MNRRVDQLLASVETLTLKAHESLAEYQQKKREAAQALGAAGRQFLLAQRAFRKADDLVVDLTAIKDAHIALSHAANDLLAQGNSSEARQVLHDLMKTRRTLRLMCRRIERCRRDGLSAPNDRTQAQELRP